MAALAVTPLVCYGYAGLYPAVRRLGMSFAIQAFIPRTSGTVRLPVTALRGCQRKGVKIEVILIAQTLLHHNLHANRP